MIHDNILIAHELLHYLQSSKNEPNKGFVVKLDMSKAYDRVEWNFIETIMIKIGFNVKWIEKIINCVRSVKYMVKCNNILSDVIISERGLCQGYPLSPYLFFFCMEAFSRMLIKAQDNNFLRGIRASINGPRINHFFIADDALLFVRNRKSQKINFEKSMVLFSPNTPIVQRNNFSDMLGMTVVENLNNYLGLPIPIDINNRLSCRINSWTKRLLSFGGKEVFIKAVLQSIPTYALSIFLAPKGVVENIQAKLSKTWWTRKDGGRFWIMLPWKTLRKPKGMGGLGVRDVRLFNLALIGRQVWRLINNKDTLCFKVLSSKYFPDGNIFKAKKVDKAFFTWSSIAAAAEALKDGFGWQVGNGDTINIQTDNWGMEGLNGDAIKGDCLNSNETSVKDLWLADRRSWNANKVKDVFGQDWGEKICNVLIGEEGQRDKMVWFHKPHGCFTTKTTYSWLLLKEMGYGPHKIYWKAIWKLDTLPKIRVFSWRVGHEILPTKAKIASISHGVDKSCQRCGAEVETLLHALKDCPTSRAALSMGGWSDSMFSKDCVHCIDWLEDLMWALDKKAMADLMVLLWNCWNNRNNLIFRGKEDTAAVIWERARTLSDDFRICNLLKEPLISSNVEEKKWKKPPKGFVKVNFDATVRINSMGYGAIVRDDDGFVLGGGGGFIDTRMPVHVAECVAFEKSIQLATQLNIKGDVMFETDHAALVNKLRNIGTDVTVVGARIKNCIAAFDSFNSAKLIWTNRACNKVADLLCTKMCSEEKTCFFDNP
ncbi:reverse transcriptase [Gossypium australe]|uniref:Reverse transcriptase n=1 Tax=Gossypium australe TaxID=47621 RepID=A0A5B6U7Q9_9ROSI|nr:reverse transcriptase [Gossypium australe]